MAKRNYIFKETKKEAVEKCPDCGADLRYAMIDTDGTNIEEGVECTEQCGYERIGD